MARNDQDTAGETSLHNDNNPIPDVETEQHHSQAGLLRRLFDRAARLFFQNGPQALSSLTTTETLIDAEPSNSPLDGISNEMENRERRPENVDLLDLHSLLAEVATGVWRMRRRLARNDHSQPPDELRRISRDIEMLRTALEERQVEIRDHVGERYVPGMALKILSFQPTLGIGHEKISETIKPTVYFQDTLIQPGEVIVATPEAPAAESQSGEIDSTSKDPNDARIPATQDEETDNGTLDD